MGLWVGFVGKEVSVLYVWEEKKWVPGDNKGGDYVIYLFKKFHFIFFLLATESVCIF